MEAPGGKFGRKKEEAIAALLTQRKIEEAAKTAGIGANTSCAGSRYRSFRPPTVTPGGPLSGKPLPDSSREHPPRPLLC